MRQHIINSSNINGIQAGIRQASVVAVAARDESTLEMRTSWKPLSKSKCKACHNHVVVHHDPVVVTGPSYGRSNESTAFTSSSRQAAANRAAWPAAANDLPAAVWARLVVRRAISI